MKKLVSAFISLSFVLLVSVSAFAATSNKAVSYETKTVGGVKLDIVIVNQKDPSIGLKVSLVDNKLERTKKFADIAADEGAIVSVNGNFFEAYKDNKTPIGNLMLNGELAYSSAGTPNIGFAADGTLSFGMAGFFIHHVTIPRNVSEEPLDFIAYDTNVRGQTSKTARLYTPYFGTSFAVTYAGTVYVFENDALKSVSAVSNGQTVAIPAAGYVIFHAGDIPESDKAVNAAAYIGCKADREYRLYNPDDEVKSGFKDKTITQIMAGNARLVANGSSANAATTYGGNASDQRWTSSAPRTAIGELKDGRLIIVSTAGATLKKLADALVSLGCVNAVNLDGGGSRGMAVDGKVVAKPGRNLTVTFHVIDKNKKKLPEAKDYSAFAPRYTAYAEALQSLGVLPAGDLRLNAPLTRGEAAAVLSIVTGAEVKEEKPGDPVSAREYFTMLLKAGGYSEGGDFTADKAVAYAQSFYRVTPQVTYYEWDYGRAFNRDDMAVVTYNFLKKVKFKPYYPGNYYMCGKLVSMGAFTAEQARAAGFKELTYA